jgi:hypothetical protein
MSEIDTPTFTQTTSEDNLSLAKEIKNTIQMKLSDFYRERNTCISKT